WLHIVRAAACMHSAGPPHHVDAGASHLAFLRAKGRRRAAPSLLRNSDGIHITEFDASGPTRDSSPHLRTSLSGRLATSRRRTVESARIPDCRALRRECVPRMRVTYLG